MKLYYPGFYRDFHCLAGACPDSCCRQGWQIVIDDVHKDLYEGLEGKLGAQVRRALETVDGETSLHMENGTCVLLQEDGLCPIAAQLGEEGLCHICHTHPRFLEEYGGTREIHLSLSCPEAARLAAEAAEIRFESEQTEEEVSCCNEIDPEEYFALLTARDFALNTVQDENLPFYDRLALLLQAARRLQRAFDQGKHELCKPILEVTAAQSRHIARTRRLRLKGTSYFAEIEVFSALEHLTEEFPSLLRRAVFTAKDGKEFDHVCAPLLQRFCALWLAHYIPKAVCDGRIDSKIRFCVLLTLAVRRLCLCENKCSPADAMAMAGLLAKEIEHSEENVKALWSILENDSWHEHLTTQLPLTKKGDTDAI